MSLALKTQYFIKSKLTFFLRENLCSASARLTYYSGIGFKVIKISVALVVLNKFNLFKRVRKLVSIELKLQRSLNVARWQTFPILFISFKQILFIHSQFLLLSIKYLQIFFYEIHFNSSNTEWEVAIGRRVSRTWQIFSKQNSIFQMW